MAYRVLIVDDHWLSRKGIRAVLEADPDFAVIGEAADAAEALEKVRALRPDLILMDIRLPEVNGLEATRQIKAEFPQAVIVILSVSDEPQDLLEAIKRGAQGYLLKDLQPELWLTYLRSVVAGQAPISRELASQLLAEFREPGDDRTGSSPASGQAETGLSDRELEILRAVAQGLSNREIGEQLGIAESTVKNHLRNILDKLQLRNRAQLVAYAYERRWLRPGRL